MDTACNSDNVNCIHRFNTRDSNEFSWIHIVATVHCDG